MNFSIKKAVPYLIAIATFILISVAYFSPILEGKKIFQNDIKHFTGMAKEINDFRIENDAEPYWTNAAFGGMPTYNLSVLYPNDYVKKIDQFLRFLPRPADYLFLYFLGFFILLLVLKVEVKLAILGALAFGFSTYFIIILGVGHNSKAHAIAYMPMVLAGILLVLQRNYLWGFLLTAVTMSLEINASHPQMTYYLFFAVLILGIFYLIEAFKEKQLPSFFKSIAILIVAVVLAIGTNATSLLATKEYVAHSTRGKSELTINPDGSPKEASNGLSKEYITDYSYGILETFNLFIPRFMGGGNYENVGMDSHIYNFLKDKTEPRQAKEFSEFAPMYWGKQPGVEAPAYIGAVLVFLFVLGIFFVKGNLKKWLVGVVIFSILLSWGKNLNFLTDFFIDYVPMYNKFRAVSSIQVIAELAVPLLGILGLNEFFKNTNTAEIKLNALKNTFYITGSIALIFMLFGTPLQRIAWDTVLRVTRAQQNTPLHAIASLNNRLASKVESVLRAGHFPLVVGGDHSCAIGTWSGVHRALADKGPLGLIWIDAHMDSHTFASTPSGQIHGMPLACLLGYGDAELTSIDGAEAKLHPEHVCLIGVRSFEAGEAALLHQLGVRVFDMEEIHRRGLAEVFDEALTIVRDGTAGFGVSVDLDAFDPTEEPGVGSPVPGGLRRAELAEALTRLRGDPSFVAMEVAEYNPIGRAHV